MIVPTALRCATLVTADVDLATERYRRWFGYATLERGVLDAALAAMWRAPASAGRAMAVCAPPSGTDIYLRLVEGEPVADYRPMRSTGWAAIELCVTDVEAVHARLAGSPFVVIGPPTPIGGLPTIRPMQVRGPDGETIFLTEILTDDPLEGLPSPASLIDHLFIQVLACRDLDATARWFGESLHLAVDPSVTIRYSTINTAFALPADTRHRIATLRYGGRIILELDQYPAAVVERPGFAGTLSPGVAIATLALPGIDRLDVDWIVPPVAHDGVLYGGRRAGTVRTPEGALLEVIEG